MGGRRLSSHAERYKPHGHRLVNVNDLKRGEHEVAGFNTRIAVALTKSVGSMVCAYVFAVLALIGLFGLLGWLNPFVFLFTTWISQQFLQLVLLPIIMVGNNTINHHTELEADETYQSTAKIFKDVETLMEQNNKQFEMLEAQNKVLETHYQELLRQTAMLNTALTPRRRPMKQVEVKHDD